MIWSEAKVLEYGYNDKQEFWVFKSGRKWAVLETSGYGAAQRWTERFDSKEKAMKFVENYIQEWEMEGTV